MDPDACLSDLFDSMAQGDYAAAGQKASDLLEWLGKGGFAPGAGKLRESSLRSFLDAIHLQNVNEDDVYMEPSGSDDWEPEED